MRPPTLPLPPSPAAPQGLLWNARQAAPWRVASLDPDFEDYAARAFAFAPTQGLYGLLAALHVCRRVVLYGFGLSQQHGGCGAVRGHERGMVCASLREWAGDWGQGCLQAFSFSFVISTA